MLRAPAKQTAAETISTLSSRLQSATLLEDRRAAILGLRSFAKLYPASVASGALRDLISSLRKDGDDLDTIKVVLETLLMLFAPDEKSSEAAEEIALWLADEFTQRQDNITVLLDLLESRDFYSRLYSLQLISHISTARPERTQECIFTAPLGVSRLVAVLDDKREAVRNEALLLLIALTPSSTELQKVVAFENGFDRIFALIEAEGSLTHGSTTVQDCLSLLANLLNLNLSNQSYFREMGCIPKLARSLSDVSIEEESTLGVSEWIKPQRDINVWGLLAIIRLFLTDGSQGTALNQVSFWRSGIVVQILYFAFSPELSVSIRAKSLATCADMVRGNAALQAKFGDLAVPKVRWQHFESGKGSPATNGLQTMNVVEALLKLTLEPASSAIFDVRLAACECIKAFFSGHSGIRTYFLQRAIIGFRSGDDEIPNIITVLMQPNATLSSDPYQIWMASVLLFHLLFENAEGKALALKISEGDAENGEEVITCIQSLTGNFIAGVQRGGDQRALVGYSMLLCGWLFEDPDATNDLLSEGSSVQSLIQVSKANSQSASLVAGLCTALLGIIYEFSTKDSPVPRATIHDLLTKGLGREVYIDRLAKLRANPFVRDYEVLPQGSSGDVQGGLPNIFFDKTFVDFLKDNFSRFLRVIDRDPGLEVSIITNGIQKGISRELVDSLRAQVSDRSRAAQELDGEIVSLRSRFEQEELEHRRRRDSTAVELGRIRQINESLQQNHEEELRNIAEATTYAQKEMQGRMQEQVNAMDVQIRQNKSENDEVLARIRERNEAEITDLKNTIQELQKRLQQSAKDHIQDLQTAYEEYNSKITALEARVNKAGIRAEEAEETGQRIAAQLRDEIATAQELRTQVEEKEAAREAAQTELDDLLIVFGDLESKRYQDKKRLKALGENVSDVEDDEEPGEETVDEGGSDTRDGEAEDHSA